ncbi:hypothetical protein FBU59_000123 [Linderina macrospora]|uniref:Uncharacterized protein n=1 Tax=Linderina macrospora TaxID=4868 RepID=A0ACC1JI31_9FUNG|nr:hypothetical protein FBU59_000123 [Linderina macrospora]
MLAPLISGILGSALIVHRVFAGTPTITTWTAANTLSEVSASSMTGLHFGLLSRLLRGIPNAPSASKRIAMRAGSLAVAVVFGVLVGAGYAVLRSGASPHIVKTA